MTDTATALIREAAERLHDARREALHAEADRVQGVSLDDLMLADDEAARWLRQGDPQVKNHDLVHGAQ